MSYSMDGNSWVDFFYHNSQQASKALRDGKVELSEKLSQEALANATLALAFEQRTANLIAWQALGIQIESQNGNTSEPSPEAEDDIANRLGLGGSND